MATGFKKLKLDLGPGELIKRIRPMELEFSVKLETHVSPKHVVDNLIKFCLATSNNVHVFVNTFVGKRKTHLENI